MVAMTVASQTTIDHCHKSVRTTGIPITVMRVLVLLSFVLALCNVEARLLGSRGAGYRTGPKREQNHAHTGAGGRPQHGGRREGDGQDRIKEKEEEINKVEADIDEAVSELLKEKVKLEVQKKRLEGRQGQRHGKRGNRGGA